MKKLIVACTLICLLAAGVNSYVMYKTYVVYKTVAKSAELVSEASIIVDKASNAIEKLEAWSNEHQELVEEVKDLGNPLMDALKEQLDKED